MPSCQPDLGVAEAEATIRGACAVPAPAPPCVGVEAEWLVVPAGDPTAHADHASVAAAVASLGPLPGGSTVTWEPGGQVELSTPPLEGARPAVSALAGDLARLRSAVEATGHVLLASGIDPHRPPRRVVTASRYCAMEAFFDAAGPHGRRMMCTTAAIQVNVACTPERWRTAHALGPVLTAAFANSPVAGGAATGWKSTRASVWGVLDRTRTSPVGGADPMEAWLRYALDARVMYVRTGAETCVPVLDPGFTLRRWIDHGHPLGWPGADDVLEHLTTLFPPLRYRGWIELRMIDALPDPWLGVPAAVVAAVLDDPEASERVRAACSEVDAAWDLAAADALAHPGLAAAALEVFDAALESGAAGLADEVGAYRERYVARGETPADEFVRAHRREALAWA